MSKPFELNLRYLGQRMYRSGKMYSMTFPWPWPGHGCGIDKHKFPCLHNKVRTTHPLTTKLGSYISQVRFITWLDFGEILLYFFSGFSLKISDVFFQGQPLFWTYLRNGWSDWHETKWRCIGWILAEICDLDLWPHPRPWPWIFQGQISK